MSELLYDDKPTVVRQCLGALHELAVYRPEMTDKICQAALKSETSKYKDSMSPLIEKDRKALLKMLE